MKTCLSRAATFWEQQPLKTYAPNLRAFRANSKSKTSQRIWLAKSSIVWQIARHSAFIFPTLGGTLARILRALWAFVRHIAYMPLFGPAR